MQHKHSVQCQPTALSLIDPTYHSRLYASWNTAPKQCHDISSAIVRQQTSFIRNVLPVGPNFVRSLAATGVRWRIGGSDNISDRVRRPMASKSETMDQSHFRADASDPQLVSSFRIQ
jgi:hypothetical protein